MQTNMHNIHAQYARIIKVVMHNQIQSKPASNLSVALLLRSGYRRVVVSGGVLQTAEDDRDVDSIDSVGLFECSGDAAVPAP